MPSFQLNSGDVKHTADSATSASTATATGTTVTVVFNGSASAPVSTGTAVTADTKTDSDNHPKIRIKGKEYPSITYNGMVHLPNDILSMLFGKTYELNKIEYNRLCDLFEKGHDSNFNTVKIGLTAKDLASLSVTCSTFNRYIGGNRNFQSATILPFALQSPRLTDIQLAHLGAPILKQAIMRGELTVGTAIRNTQPNKIAQLVINAWNGYCIQRTIKLGYQPNQIRESWFSNEHFELLEQRQKLQEELMKAKTELDNLIKQNNELKAIAAHNKKQRDETLTRIQMENKEKMEKADESVSELSKMGDDATDQNFKKTRRERLTKETEEALNVIVKMMEENKKMDAAEPKEQAERDKKEKEANEKYAKLDRELKEFENIFAYEKIKGLNAQQVKALRLGLLPTQLKGITDEHLKMLEELKQSKHSAEKIQSLFEGYKKFTALQVKGIIAGFSTDQVSKTSFSQTSIDGIKAGFTADEALESWFSETSIKGVKAGFTKDEVSKPSFSEYSIYGLAHGFTRKDLAEGWFSQTHYTLASSGYTVEELRGLTEDKVKVLRYGYDRKTLLDIKTKIEPHHLKAIEAGCPLIDVLNFDSQQCEVLVAGQKLGLDAKTLFDRKTKVELFHLEAVEKGYELDEVILLQKTQCRVLIACNLKPKDLIGLDEIENRAANHSFVEEIITIIRRLKIHPKEFNELLVTLALNKWEGLLYKLFDKCSFEQAKKLNRDQLLFLAISNLSYEDAIHPNFAALIKHPYTRNIISSGKAEFKDLIHLDINALFLLQRGLWPLKEVLQMDKKQLVITRKTEMSVTEYHRLHKIAQEHKLNSEQLMAMSSKYGLALEQVTIPNFTFELARAVKRGAKFDEARELNETQLKLFNYCNDTWRPLEQRITIQQARQPWISRLFLVAITSEGFSYKEIEGLNGPQLVAFLAGHSKEEALNNSQLSSHSPLFFSEANKRFQGQFAKQQVDPKQPSTEDLNAHAAAGTTTTAVATTMPSTAIASSSAISGTTAFATSSSMPGRKATPQ